MSNTQSHTSNDLPHNSAEFNVPSSPKKQALTFFEWNTLKWAGHSMTMAFGTENARSVLFADIALYSDYLAALGTEIEIIEWRNLRDRVTGAPFDFVPRLQQAKGTEGVAGKVFSFAECLVKYPQPHTLSQRYTWYRQHLKSRKAVRDEVAYNEARQERMDGDRRELYGRSREADTKVLQELHATRKAAEALVNCSRTISEAVKGAVKGQAYMVLEILLSCLAREIAPSEEDQRRIEIFLYQATGALLNALRDRLALPLDFFFLVQNQTRSRQRRTRRHGRNPRLMRRSRSRAFIANAERRAQEQRLASKTLPDFLEKVKKNLVLLKENIEMPGSEQPDRE